MKKSILMAASALLLGGASVAAQVSIPRYFSEDFEQMALDGDLLTPDWVTYGIGATPIEQLLPYYGTLVPGSDPEKFDAPYHNYILLSAGNTSVPISCTNFTDSETADEWMITPAITIPEGLAELKFDTFSYSISTWVTEKSGNFEVLMSTTGTAKEDFTSIYAGTITPKPSSEIVQRTIATPIPDCGGKTIHLAFVNKGKNIGNVGFTNIEVGNYAFTYSNQTESIVPKGTKTPVRVNLGMKTPVECPGFTATLKCGDLTVEKYYKKALGGRGTSYVFQLVTFDGKDELIDLSDGVSKTYTLTITPDFEGATPSVITGSIVVPEKYYPKNVVMEELTATGCGWCPRGIGAMEYYKDVMPGNDGQGKFIGIAVHDNMNYHDPMNDGVQGYVNSAKGMSGSTGLPQATFNRVIRGVEPSKVSAFNSVREEEAIFEATIKGVTCNENLTIGDPIVVRTDVRAGFNSESTAITAAAVLIENNVKGYGDGYNQENYLATRRYSDCGIDGVPEQYYTKYLMGGEYPSVIRFDKIVYQDVARGIWPTFSGQDIQNQWTADVPQSNDITFNVPENIVNIDDKGVLQKENFEVAVLIIDKESGEIVASDIFPLNKSNSTSVGSIASDSAISVSAEGAMINVSGEGALNVDLYTIDGIKLGSCAGNGYVSIDGSAFSGVVILRATNGTDTMTRKLVF